MAYVQPSGKLERAGYNKSAKKSSVMDNSNSEGTPDPVKSGSGSLAMKGITKTADKGYVSDPYEKTQEVITVSGEKKATLFRTGSGDVYKNTKYGSKEDVLAKKQFTADSTNVMRQREFNAGKANIGLHASNLAKKASK